MARHRWQPLPRGFQCIRCGGTKRAVCWIYGTRILWTYLVRGIRYTGFAPGCEKDDETINSTDAAVIESHVSHRQGPNAH